MSKYTDTVKITIRLNDETGDMEDAKDLIVSNLKGLIEKLEYTNGDMQKAYAGDNVSELEYVHVKSL